MFQPDLIVTVRPKKLNLITIFFLSYNVTEGTWIYSWTRGSRLLGDVSNNELSFNVNLVSKPLSMHDSFSAVIQLVGVVC